MNSKNVERYADDITIADLVRLRKENAELKELLDLLTNEKLTSTANFIDDMLYVIKNIDEAYMNKEGERVMFEYARNFLVKNKLV
jgi:hypothetical protein